MWERHVDADKFLEALIESVVRSDEQTAEAEKTLFSQDGAGKVIAPRTADGGGGPVKINKMGEAFYKLSLIHI